MATKLPQFATLPNGTARGTPYQIYPIIDGNNRVVGFSADGGDIYPLPSLALDAQFNAIGFKDQNGLPVTSYSSVVNTSRSAVVADFDTILKCSSSVVITVPTDATLGISDPTYSPSIILYAVGATPPSFSTTGLTIRNTAPTIAQYGRMMLTRVGANEWAYPA